MANATVNTNSFESVPSEPAQSIPEINNNNNIQNLFLTIEKLKNKNKLLETKNEELRNESKTLLWVL